MPNSVELVIKAFGGVRKTAKAVGCTPPTVSKWRKFGHISRNGQVKIAGLIKQKKVKLKIEHLVIGN
jgi:hypothetical protein